eukprot:6184968-Pleurochrysis_carterae.AAC.1
MHRDCLCGDRTERRGARQGSSQLISSFGGGSQGGNPTTRRPGCGSPLARARCKCTPRAGVHGEGQGGRHSHCQLSHERSEAVDSRRVERFDAQAFREGPRRVYLCPLWHALKARRYRHWLPGGLIRRSGTPAQDHARLVWHVPPILYLYGSYLERPSGGCGKMTTINIKYQQPSVGEAARVRGLCGRVALIPYLGSTYILASKRITQLAILVIAIS